MRRYLRTPVPIPEPRRPPEPAPDAAAEPSRRGAAAEPTRRGTGAPGGVVVALVGPRHLAGALGRHLPDGSRVQPEEDLPVGTDPDVIVLADATAAAVAAALLRHPSTPVIGLIDPLAPVQTLVDVLEAGADTCVRSGETVLLASHLLACLRRRQVQAGLAASAPAER